MIKSKKLYSPQSYLEAVTGTCFIVDGDNDIELIEELLSKHCENSLWSYEFTNISYIVSENINVVLVECMVYDEKKNEYDKVYRWFEVPEDFAD